MAVTSALVDSTTRTSSNGTTATATGVTFGTAFTGRVLIDAYVTGNQTDPTGGSIGGVAGTFNNLAGNGIGLQAALVPTGTSGNVVETFSSADEFDSLGVVALTGASSATPTASINNTSGGSGTINVPAGGCVVAFAIKSGASGTWTGATAVRTTTIFGGAFTASIATFDNSGGALTGRTISYSSGIGLVAWAFDAYVGADDSRPIFRTATRILRRKRF